MSHPPAALHLLLQQSFLVGDPVSASLKSQVAERSVRGLWERRSSNLKGKLVIRAKELVIRAKELQNCKHKLGKIYAETKLYRIDMQDKEVL